MDPNVLRRATRRETHHRISPHDGVKLTEQASQQLISIELRNLGIYIVLSPGSTTRLSSSSVNVYYYIVRHSAAELAAVVAPAGHPYP